MEEARLAEIATLRAEVVARSEAGWDDIRLHMEPLFDLVLDFKPTVLVELGIRGGVSTFALERAARLCDARMLCIDHNDCSGVVDYADFVQTDDVFFASVFPTWGRERGYPPSVDFLMIDTQHTYVHTMREVLAWLPRMSTRCMMAFHDTNAKPLYDGVAAFLRDWLDIPFPEELPFKASSGPWRIDHNPDCYGLTVVRKG